MNKSANNNFRSLFVHLKRTESLDYELTNLLNTSSEYYTEFSNIFEIWVDNPCPKIHTELDPRDQAVMAMGKARLGGHTS